MVMVIRQFRLRRRTQSLLDQYLDDPSRRLLPDGVDRSLILTQAGFDKALICSATAGKPTFEFQFVQRGASHHWANRDGCAVKSYVDEQPGPLLTALVRMSSLHRLDRP